MSWSLAGLLACLALAGTLRRAAPRPVVRCLVAMAALSLARLAAPSGALGALLWLLWPAPAAALAARAWRRSWAPPAAAAGLYAVACLVLPPAGFWTGHAWLWGWARLLPHAAGTGWVLGAWGTRVRRGGVSGAVAAVLGVSGFADLTVGALALEPYHEGAARSVALVTWGAVAVVLGAAWYLGACPRKRTPR